VPLPRFACSHCLRTDLPAVRSIAGSSSRCARVAGKLRRGTLRSRAAQLGEGAMGGAGQPRLGRRSKAHGDALRAVGSRHAAPTRGSPSPAPAGGGGTAGPRAGAQSGAPPPPSGAGEEVEGGRRRRVIPRLRRAVALGYGPVAPIRGLPEHPVIHARGMPPERVRRPEADMHRTRRCELGIGAQRPIK